MSKFRRTLDIKLNALLGNPIFYLGEVGMDISTSYRIKKDLYHRLCTLLDTQVDFKIRTTLIKHLNLTTNEGE